MHVALSSARTVSAAEALVPSSALASRADMDTQRSAKQPGRFHQVGRGKTRDVAGQGFDPCRPSTYRKQAIQA